MAKVTLPLGSEQAHGTIGKSLIFQGTTVKAYRRPAQPNSAAQVVQNDQFQSVNKMLTGLASWGRGALLTVLGSNWFPLAYQVIVDRWDLSGGEYASFSVADKAGWVNFAPYTETKVDRGKTFYACAIALSEMFDLKGQGRFTLLPVVSSYGEETSDWWTKSLESVFLGGKYDSTHADITYLSAMQWSTVNTVDAYGGSYKLSTLNGSPYVEFWFYGRHVKMIYRNHTNQSGVRVQIDGLAPMLFSQNGPTAFQLEWTSPQIPAGLHYCNIFRDGADGSMNFDALEIVQ